LVEGPDGIVLARRLARGQLEIIALPTRVTAIPGAAYIPGGPVVGADGQPWLRVAGFHLALREVTSGEWLEFLNDPAVLLRHDEALAAGELILAPRLAYNAQDPLWRRLGGIFLLERQDGTPVDPQLPVTGISAQDAAEYATWRRQRDSIPWRLPTQAERMLAVQGGDGRPYPWGDADDPGLCASAITVRDPVPGGSFPWDRSLQGVLDLAGSVSEFAASSSGASASGLCPLLGGNRFDRDPARLTAFQRRDLDPRWVHPGAGLRLAADTP
jgi:formylglycine-generating enzyme required for sulfatase activity